MVYYTGWQGDNSFCLPQLYWGNRIIFSLLCTFTHGREFLRGVKKYQKCYISRIIVNSELFCNWNCDMSIQEAIDGIKLISDRLSALEIKVNELSQDQPSGEPVPQASASAVNVNTDIREFAKAFWAHDDYKSEALWGNSPLGNHPRMTSFWFCRVTSIL